MKLFYMVLFICVQVVLIHSQTSWINKQKGTVFFKCTDNLEHLQKKRLMSSTKFNRTFSQAQNYYHQLTRWSTLISVYSRRVVCPLCQRILNPRECSKFCPFGNKGWQTTFQRRLEPQWIFFFRNMVILTFPFFDSDITFQGRGEVWFCSC